MDDMELYRKFETVLIAVIDAFEKEHNCEINVRLIDVQPKKDE